MTPQKAIAITPGDPSGIGPEIVAQAFAQAPDVLRGCFVLGSAALMQRAARLRGAAHVLRIDDAAQAWAAPPAMVPVLELGAAQLGCTEEQIAQIVYGQISPIAGAFSAQCVITAATMALNEEVCAIVTAPIHKEAWRAAQVPFPGHTELLAHTAAQAAGVSAEQMPVRMMLANAQLRTVLVSIHVSLRQALAQVTRAQVLQSLRITHAALASSLGRSPRIAVAGVNPHAGEGGLFGREEIEEIHPAIADAQREGIDAQGSFAPDTVFMMARGFKRFDVVLAMYHDQGLIPIKYLGIDDGVNVTLGLHNKAGRALIRTSPDHGTAFDIAGQGIADASSLIKAVAIARSMTAQG